MWQPGLGPQAFKDALERPSVPRGAPWRWIGRKKIKEATQEGAGKGAKAGLLRPLPGTELPGTEARKGRPLTADLPGDRPASRSRVRPLSWGRILDSTFWFATKSYTEWIHLPTPGFPEFFCCWFFFFPLKANLSSLRPSCAHLTLQSERTRSLCPAAGHLHKKASGPAWSLTPSASG